MPKIHFYSSKVGQYFFHIYDNFWWRTIRPIISRINIRMKLPKLVLNGFHEPSKFRLCEFFIIDLGGFRSAEIRRRKNKTHYANGDRFIFRYFTGQSFFADFTRQKRKVLRFDNCGNFAGYLLKSLTRFALKLWNLLFRRRFSFFSPRLTLSIENTLLKVDNAQKEKLARDAFLFTFLFAKKTLQLALFCIQF